MEIPRKTEVYRVPEDQCPICRSTLGSPRKRSRHGESTRLSCPLCGDFSLTGESEAHAVRLTELNPERRVNISHVIRQSRHRDHAFPLFMGNSIEKMMNRPLPHPSEQANLLIRWLGEVAPTPGDEVTLDSRYHHTIIGARSHRGFALVIAYLLKDSLLAGGIQRYPAIITATVSLTFKGWKRYEELHVDAAVYRKAFMAMKFGDNRLDRVVNSVFRNATKRAGFELVRFDDVSIAGLIDDRLRKEIQSSDLVIADLSHENQGAYWEAGYAEGLGKPVIYTCEKQKFNQTQTHFDTNHHWTVKWDEINPWPAGDELTKTIRKTLPHLAILEDNEALRKSEVEKGTVEVFTHGFDPPRRA